MRVSHQTVYLLAAHGDVQARMILKDSPGMAVMADRGHLVAYRVYRHRDVELLNGRASTSSQSVTDFGHRRNTEIMWGLTFGDRP